MGNGQWRKVAQKVQQKTIAFDEARLKQKFD